MPPRIQKLHNEEVMRRLEAIEKRFDTWSERLHNFLKYVDKVAPEMFKQHPQPPGSHVLP